MAASAARAPTSRLAVLAAALAWAVALPVPAAAQATVHLPPLDPVYRDLAEVVSLGLVDTVLVGQRPWSRRQAARIAAQALRNEGRLAGSPTAPHARRVLDRLSTRLGPDLAALGAVRASSVAPDRIPVLDEVRLDATWTDSPARGVPDNTLAATDARLNPLVAYDEGREVEEGGTAGAETTLRGRLGSPLAWQLRPRFQVGSGGATDVDLHSGQVRLLWGNAALTAGRAHVVWGQSRWGGLLGSTNAPALTLVSLASEDPVVLPWRLSALGPARFTVLWADLGGDRHFPHSYLLDFKASFQPHPRVEVGVGFLNESGGEGAPEASLGDRILDHLFVPDLLVDRELEISQKMISLEGRVRVPGWRGLEAWVELALDDFDLARVGSMLTEDGGWVVGVRLARLDPAGTLGLTLEGQHTGIRFYRHHQFRSGLTADGRVLGTELGPDGQGLYASLDWERSASQVLTLSAAVERRSNDHYLAIQGNPFYFSRTRLLPREERARLVGEWETRRWSPGAWRVVGRAGVERVTDFAFAAGDTRTHFLGGVVVEIRTR